MSFESLPNELMIECFKYFNVEDIFHSFDQLNFRFYTLIRNIPLDVYCCNANRSRFDHICHIIHSNREIQRWIRSLHLSNENFCQINLFLSLFPKLNFPKLRSLALIELTELDRSRLLTLASFLSQLSCIHLIKCRAGIHEILSSIETKHLQVLTVSELFRRNQLLCNISSLQYLTLSTCNSKKLHQILNIATQLIYMSIDFIVGRFYYEDPEKDDSTEIQHAINLKRFIVRNYDDKLSNLELIFKRTPNLQNLSISVRYRQTIDANQWQNWISNFLPQLKKFRFYFHVSRLQIANNISEVFAGFQSDFWQKQHQWYTEYVVLKHSASIYSTPYFFDSFILENVLSKYDHPLISNSDRYNEVKHLTIGRSNPWNNQQQFHFLNVHSLEFSDQSSFDLHHLMQSVNLNHIEELIFKVEVETKLSFLLNLLEEVPNISSLTIYVKILVPLFNDVRSCSYLKQMIKRLNIVESPFGFDIDLSAIRQLWQTSSDVERRHSSDMLQDLLMFLITSLPKLSRIDVSAAARTLAFNTIGFVKQVAQKLDLLVTVDTNYTEQNQATRIVWTTR